jgi:hypothetical protein
MYRRAGLETKNALIICGSRLLYIVGANHTHLFARKQFMFC